VKTFEDFMNDPRIRDEPMGLRITHAMRFKVQEETSGMTKAERTAYYRAGSAEYARSNGDDNSKRQE
jgi:hypothetical protein